MPDLPNNSRFCISLGARGRDATHQNSPSLQLCREIIAFSRANIPARANAVAVRAESAQALSEYHLDDTVKAGTIAIRRDVTPEQKTT
tara:strand:+ start:350174 stop:350437 length:264 start_codon:yes stop_codon:yes gene_type:complete